MRPSLSPKALIRYAHIRRAVFPRLDLRVPTISSQVHSWPSLWSARRRERVPTCLFQRNEFHRDFRIALRPSPTFNTSRELYGLCLMTLSLGFEFISCDCSLTLVGFVGYQDADNPAVR